MKNLYIKPVTEIYDMDIDTMMQTISVGEGTVDPGQSLVKDNKEDNWEEL